jgi:ring-1,2-phenylacetyl-CoA epoxidase subunit PaaE
MRQFHKLTVAQLRNETADSIRVSFAVPAELQADFAFQPGQHLPVQASIDGRLARRTYSICSVPGQWPLEIGIRVQPGGTFSEFAASELKVGDTLEAMPPFGQFHATIDASHAKTYLGIAAGSGITPILSIIRAVLEGEPASGFVLFYGNRQQRSTMFIDDLYALKNRFPERLQLHFLFSREDQEFSVYSGRLDEAKILDLCKLILKNRKIDEAFVCGPGDMIESARRALQQYGTDITPVHAERYGAPRQKPGQSQTTAQVAGSKPISNITVIMDGHEKSFAMTTDDRNIVDAAAAHGIELPYSCKGGVCATCRTWVRDGSVSMEVNYGLEPWEIDKGYILACQSLPTSKKLVLDYDNI